MKRWLVLLELVLAALAAALGVFAGWRGLFSFRSWSIHPSDAFTEGWLLLMAAAAFAAAARFLHRAPRINWLLHIGAFCGALLPLYALAEWPVQLHRVRVVIFLAAIGVGAVAVLAVAELASRNLVRGLKLFGLTLAGAAALGVTIWLVAANYARFTADMLLMTHSEPYLAEGLTALRQAVVFGLPIGLICGGVLVWRRRHRGEATARRD